MIKASRLALLALVMSLVFTAACDLTRFTANSTSKMFGRAAPALEQLWDYELAGAAAPGNIAQVEGMLRVVPDNRSFLLSGIRAYCAYAYGWVEDEADRLEVAGDFEGSAYQHDRAKFLYMRGRDLGFHYIALDHDGREEAMRGGMESFQAWLNTEFTEQEDAVILVWTGYAWGSAINNGKNDLALVADLPFAEAMIERAVELDESVNNYAGLVFLAVVQSSSLSGDPERGRELFERAIEGNDRRYLLAQFNMARTYAVRTQNRDLFVSLLREVLEAGDIYPEQRLANVLAKHKALRLLRRVDELF